MVLNQSKCMSDYSEQIVPLSDIVMMKQDETYKTDIYIAVSKYPTNLINVYNVSYFHFVKG